MAELTETIHLRVDAATRAALAAEAAASQSSIGRIIRLALADHFARHPNPTGGTRS